MRELTSIAAAILECAEAWEPWAQLIGNVRADEVAALARAFTALAAGVPPPDAREAEALLLCLRAVEATQRYLDAAGGPEADRRWAERNDAQAAAVKALKVLDEGGTK